jgi:hypothetical protein
MIRVIQKPARDVRTAVARPKTGETPLAPLRVPAEDWTDLHELHGRERAHVVQQLIRWYLRRPGAKLPERPPVDRIAEVVRGREAADQ